MISLRRQLDRATQFAKELSSNDIDVNAYSTGPYVNKKSSHRVKKKSVNKRERERAEWFISHLKIRARIFVLDKTQS